MSDGDLPPGDLPDPESDAPHENAGVWQRFRSQPVWLQILAVLVVVAAIVGGIAWATGGSDGDVASTETTAASGGNAVEVVIKGLIVGGLLIDSSAPTTDAPASTPEPTATPTTVEPTTAAPPTTSTDTTAPETTAPARPVEPTTPAPETSEPPDTEPADTTEVPDTTEPPDTTEAPSTTAGASPVLPSVAAFFAQWNDASAGTDVPKISATDARELTGDYAGYYLITLTASGQDLPPQVGLVGTATAPGSGQLDELMLVWIPGADDESSAFYWDCFDVLVRAVSPGATPGEIDRLGGALGRTPDTPPFTRTAEASSGGLDYRAFTLPYTGDAGPLDVSAIEIT